MSKKDSTEVFTPSTLIDKILDKIDLRNKSILVMFNLEFLNRILKREDAKTVKLICFSNPPYSKS